MSMPQIPENKHRPKLREAIIDLLESIALEEISLSHLLNAEAERIQAFIGKNQDFPTSISIDEILCFNKTSSNLLDTIIMKEWILYKKLLAALEVLHKIHFCRDECYEDD
ncbi:MAG: hypothetical protein ACM3UU_08305 [Ignavibacteriales bacterium]